MGVPGLWDLLRPAAARTSLSTLAKDAFFANKHNLRALTIGIDASIWIFHAQIPMHGENPFLRTIFYKITTLLQHPVLPVFVFDGPNKPSHKRNQAVAGHFGTADHRSREFKALLDECGLEWYNAPGEAEAELAVMNRQGKIDAVLSDDADALLFGATCLLRNNSPTLSGTQASTTATSSRSDLRTYEMYRSSAILSHWSAKPATSLVTEEACRLAMVYIALLAGGDYAPQGLNTVGPTIAFGLANAGFADFLKQYDPERPDRFEIELGFAFPQMVEELRTNASKHIGRKYPDRASRLSALDPSTVFPRFALDAYLKPATSPLDDPSKGWPGFGLGRASSSRGKAHNEGRGDIEGLARACERYFEWGTKEIVADKFGRETVGMLGAEVMMEARSRVRDRDSLKKPSRKGKQVDRSPSRDGRISPVQPSPSSQATSNDRITSFFSSAVPRSVLGSSAKTTAPIMETSSDMPPPHIGKICKTRPDPANPDLLEYRLTFSPDPYIQRIHSAMMGTRVDPKKLDQSQRAALGLVDRSRERDEDVLDEEDLPSASQVQAAKKGNKGDQAMGRTWIPEYLVREAWPSLVEEWEREQRAKVERANRPKSAAGARKAPAASQKKGKRIEGGGEDVEGFAKFFSQRPRHPVPEEVEEVEEVEEQRVDQEAAQAGASRTGRKSPRPRADRARATSTLSSLSSRSTTPKRRELDVLSPLSPTRSVRATSAEQPVARRPRSRTGAGVSATVKPPRRVTAVRAAPPKQTGTKEVIDLCGDSSEEDRPKSPARARRPRTPRRSSSPLTVILQSSGSKTGRKRTAKKGGGESAGTQTLLDLPVVSRNTALSNEASAKSSAKVAKETKKKWATVRETDDAEWIDCTVSRRRSARYKY